MQYGLFDEPRRKAIRVSVKKEVYKRAKGKCECCGTSLKSNEGDYHHTRSPTVSPTAKTVQFLCPLCHRRYGHKRKTITRGDGILWEEKVTVIKRKKAPIKRKTTGKKTSKRQATKKTKKQTSKKRRRTPSKKKATRKKTTKRRQIKRKKKSSISFDLW